MSRVAYGGLLFAVVVIGLGLGWVRSKSLGHANAATSAAVAAPLPPPITPASDGKLQCYAPNVAAKSCQSLAAYEATPDGRIVNPATVLISAAPLITMRTVTPVTIKANQVCGYVQPEDIEAAEFVVGDGPATSAQAAKLRQKMLAAQKGVFGREICTAYVTEGDALIAKASVDGVSEPAMDQRVMWVSPSDGFAVRP
jgi:hypothetical protein